MLQSRKRTPHSTHMSTVPTLVAAALAAAPGTDAASAAAGAIAQLVTTRAIGLCADWVGR